MDCNSSFNARRMSEDVIESKRSLVPRKVISSPARYPLSSINSLRDVR